jgi:hypothetical protein
MNVEISLSGPAGSVEALARFLKRLEGLVPEPVAKPRVVMGDDGVIYVNSGFATEEEAWVAGEKMAEVSAEIVEETNVLIVLAPFVG